MGNYGEFWESKAEPYNINSPRIGLQKHWKSKCQ